MKKPIYFLMTLLISSYCFNNIGNSYSNLNINSTKTKKSSIKLQKNKIYSDDQMKRYDGFTGVDSNLINQENNDFINNKISQFPDKYNNVPNNVHFDKKTKTFVYSKDISKFHPRDALKNFFENKSYIKADEKFNDNYTNSISNYKFGPLPHHELNYDGVYFPWWSFGDDWYWYMSSYTITEVTNLMAWGVGLSTTAITILLTTLGYASNPYVMTILTLWLLIFTFSFYNLIVTNNNLDKSDGVVIETSFLVPSIYHYRTQASVSGSPENSFEVDYSIFAPDDITVSLDENSLNTLANIWNNLVSNDAIIKFLKSLTQIDHTGPGGGILEQDYVDFCNAFLTNDFNSDDKLYSNSNIIFYIKSVLKSNWKSVDIHIERGGSAYKYWKNS